MTEQGKREAVILFMDFVRSSDASVFLDVESYFNLLTDYQTHAAQVVQQVVSERNLSRGVQGEWAVRGDEACVLLYSGDLVRDARSALRIALETKTRWLLSERNVDRFNEGKEPFEVGVGLHAGQAYLGQGRGTLGSEEAKTLRLEGYAINVGKRVESASRQGEYTRILCSNDFYYCTELGWDVSGAESVEHVLFAPEKRADLRGIAQGFRVWEVQAYGGFNMDSGAPDNEGTITRGLEVMRSNPRCFSNFCRHVCSNPSDLRIMAELLKDGIRALKQSESNTMPVAVARAMMGNYARKDVSGTGRRGASSAIRAAIKATEINAADPYRYVWPLLEDDEPYFGRIMAAFAGPYQSRRY